MKRAAQRRENILQRRQRRRGLVARQLGDESLGKLAAVSQLFLRQVILLTKAAQLLSDVDFHSKSPFGLAIQNFEIII